MHHLSGDVASGALMAVVGPNGAGKSTLFKGIVGTLKPFAGQIERNGLPATDIAYLPQAAEIDRTFPITVYDLVAMGLWRQAGLFGGIGKNERDRIRAAIAAVGLTGFEQRAIGTLSGGQMQRMLFARLCCRMRVSLCSMNRSRRSTPRLRPIFWISCGAGTRKAAPSLPLCTISSWCAANFPETLGAGARTGGVGRDRRRAHSRQPFEGAPHVRGLRRASRRMRGVRRRMLYDALIAPFAEFEFMRRALVGVGVLALGAAPIGVFLMLRRMSLVGDAMAHAILPGAAVGFLLSGLSICSR